MKDNSSENYLDQLLNSVNGDHTDLSDTPKEELLSSQQQWEKDLFGDLESDEEIVAKNEEDFLREFEAELLKDDMLSPFEELEEENNGEADDAIDDIISYMSSQPQDEDIDPLVDENAEFEGTLPDEEKSETVQDADADDLLGEDAANTMDDAVGTFDESLTKISDDLQPPMDDGGEIDLSGIGGNDLMDMLSDSGELSDLGDLLSSADEDRAVEDGDSIGDFANAEMNAREQAVEAEEETEQKSKGKKNKKDSQEQGGFLARLMKLFFGEDDEENEEAEPFDVGIDVTAGISEENKKILEELGATGELGDSNKKKEKKKKEKKPKEPKPQKPKKVKQPKPKKVKKPKEVDNTPPLPKGPVIAITIMAASLMGLILLGTNLLGYQANINAAREQYERGSFVEAYAKLQGLKIREKDTEFYEQMQVLATVSKKYQDYLVFANNENDDIALDNLICAYGRYELNKQKAEEAGCSVEYEAIGGKIIKSLLEDYDMTGEEALQMYQSKNRKEYTLKLHEKLKALGLE